jgi:hypothetical protein
MHTRRQTRQRRRRGLLLALLLLGVTALTFTARDQIAQAWATFGGGAQMDAQGPSSVSAEPNAAAELAVGSNQRLVVERATGNSANSGNSFETSRRVRLLTKTKSGWTESAALTLPNLPGEQVTISPDGPNTYMIEARLPNGIRRAAVQVEGQKLTALNWYALHSPKPEVTQGPFLYVDKALNQLWFFRDGKLVETFPVATGRQTQGPAPTAADYMTNFFTPEGLFTIDTKQKNPAYYGSAEHPPAAGGAPDNPLGTRWMGFTVLPAGDNGNIWAIHGTNEPQHLGQWVSDGCIRMRIPDVERLFEQIPLKTPLRIVKGQV